MVASTSKMVSWSDGKLVEIKEFEPLKPSNGFHPSSQLTEWRRTLKGLRLKIEEMESHLNSIDSEIIFLGDYINSGDIETFNNMQQKLVKRITLLTSQENLARFHRDICREHGLHSYL